MSRNLRKYRKSKFYCNLISHRATQWRATVVNINIRTLHNSPISAKGQEKKRARVMLYYYNNMRDKELHSSICSSVQIAQFISQRYSSICAVEKWTRTQQRNTAYVNVHTDGITAYNAFHNNCSNNKYNTRKKNVFVARCKCVYMRKVLSLQKSYFSCHTYVHARRKTPHAHVHKSYGNKTLRSISLSTRCGLSRAQGGRALVIWMVT